jgi:hypothetical protein
VGALLVSVGIPQLSLVVGIPRLTELAEQRPGSALTVKSEGPDIVGAILSVTVKLLVQVTVLLAASFTVIVTTVTPVETRVPAEGDCVIVRLAAEVQLSVTATLTVKSGTDAWQKAFAKAD